MKKEQIVYTAIERYLLHRNNAEYQTSVLGLLHDCIGNIATTGLEDNVRKQKLIQTMKNFWNGTSVSVSGCKRSQIQDTIEFIFGITLKKELHLELEDFNFQELYLYYCYMEWILRDKGCFQNFLENQYRKEHFSNKTAIQKITERNNREEEKKREIEGMDFEERMKYQIFEEDSRLGYDMKYYDMLENDEEHKKSIAAVLKEYWEGVGKWEGNKVSKKQSVKIKKVKEILEL